MSTPEGILEDYAMKLAKEHGFLFYKFMSGVTGVPDRIIVGHGHTVFMELKAKNGVLSARQKLEIRKIRNHGGTVYVPKNKEDIDAVFRELLETEQKKASGRKKKAASAEKKKGSESK